MTPIIINSVADFDRYFWQISTCFFAVLCGCLVVLDTWRHRDYINVIHDLLASEAVADALVTAGKNDAEKISSLVAEIVALKQRVTA